MNRWIWGFIIIFFVLFSLVPAFYEISRQNDLRPERYFELVHNFPTDYNFYLSRIREGREGAWTAKEKYTSEPHRGSFIQIFYVWMGEVAAWVGVPWHRSGDTYQMARVALAFGLLFIMSYAAKESFRKFGWQVVAFLLAVTAASWPTLLFHMGEWRFGGYMSWWTIMDSLQRITFIPHLVAGQTLMTGILIAITSVAVMKKAGNWIFLGLLALLLGIIDPPGWVFVVITYGIFILIDFLFRFPWKNDTMGDFWVNRVGGGAIVGLMSAPAFIYFALLFRIYPWKQLIENDLLHGQPFILPEYLRAVGPVLVVGALGGLLALLRREKQLFIFVAWVIAWFACLIVFQFIPQQSPLRFSEMLPQLPLGILGAYLFYIPWTKTKHSVQVIWLVMPVLFILLGIGQMYSSWRWQKEFIDQKIAATYPLVPTGSFVMYPLKDFISTIIFFQDNTRRTDVILSETTAGNYIPVYSGNTVFVGQSNTVRGEQKMYIVKRFYSGQMSPAIAQAFLTANSIHYIFFGPQEMDDGGLTDLANAYPFLHEIYSVGQFHVYSW